MQDIVKKIYLRWKGGKTYNFGNSLLAIDFLRDIHEGYLSLEDPDNKQSNFSIELKKFDKGIKKLEKTPFLNNLELFLVQEKKLLLALKADYFQ